MTAGREDLEKIIREPNLQAWLRRRAHKIMIKHGIGTVDDLMQDFYLGRLLGHFATIEQTACKTLHDEYCRGVTGKTKMPHGSWADEELLTRVSDRKQKAGTDLVEFLYDLRLVSSDLEYQMACLAMAGFGQYEIYEQTRGCGKAEFFNAWRSLGLGNKKRPAHQMRGIDIKCLRRPDPFAHFGGALYESEG